MKIMASLILVVSSLATALWTLSYIQFQSQPMVTLACAENDRKCLSQISGPSIWIPIIGLVLIIVSIIWLIKTKKLNFR